MTARIRHGGDLAAASTAFGTPAEGWLDLSTGINPLAYPLGNIPGAIWQRLPTGSDTKAMITAAKRYYRVPENAAISAAPGTQAIIQWLPVLRRKGTVQIIGPTYAEHAHRWSAAGHDVTTISDIDVADAEVIVLVNPNNPDGRNYSPGALLALAERQRQRQGWLIVDEAFADVTPETTIVPGSGQPGLIVLRSFGKFFGLAGLRLGFAIGHATEIDRLADAVGPWSVAGPALEIGARALDDGTWHEQTRTRLKSDAGRLDALLTQHGLRIIGGTSLFRLAETDHAFEIYQRLARAGILVRIFDDQPNWLRFGLPGPEGDWDRLENALSRT